MYAIMNVHVYIDWTLVEILVWWFGV